MVKLIDAARTAGLRVVGVEVLPDGTIRAVETAFPRAAVSDFDRFEADL
ncbi:MAG: hypothetical protein V4523_14140 [Pseudomonadota bacterium]